MTCDLERPCARCIKRNIGHLCHDEPREHEAPSKKAKIFQGNSVEEDRRSTPETSQLIVDSMNIPFKQRPDHTQDASLVMGSSSVTASAGTLQLVQPSPVPGTHAKALNHTSNLNQFIGYSNDWAAGTQNQFQDMHNYHPSYGFNAPEVTNEYNLLNDFLNSSLLDDGAMLQDNSTMDLLGQGTMLPPSLNAKCPAPPAATASQQAGPSNAALGKAPGSLISRPASVLPTDKAREYYLQAADPTGNDPAELRMERLLRAKYDAGMMKPFNYVKGYARLSSYMDGHMSRESKQRILRQLDRFRPKFREKVQTLSDLELIYVEMWFERSLMEYDRVFASMAIPACCWRRTGEIFRGNKEMAELINVPIEKLRDGKLALHEILDERSLVSYWEKFGVVAFDPAQKAIITACSLKNPDEQLSGEPTIRCCFSFTIRRDDHKIPALIVGNFLPQHSVKR